MKNIVIYGGAFDPIHNGHINMAIDASKKLDAEVFFVPARISIWKEKSSVSDTDKIRMVEQAVLESGCKRFHMSLFEMDSKKDTNYSIDTVKEFVNKYPDSNLYLLIGADQVNKFHNWKQCEEIAKLARIVAFNRPGYELNQNNIDKFNILILEGELFDVASSDIRECKNLNIPYSVLNYIIDHELYFTSRIKSYMKERRYLHSVSVARLAYEIAVANHKKDAWRYFLAGLLHDIGKDLPIEEQKEIVEKHFAEYKDIPDPIIHQFVGSYIAKTEFGIEDEEILEAIRYHTTGNKSMNDVAKVIYASDKIEPTRGFDSSDLIESMKVNIDKGFIDVLSANKEYFIKKNIKYDNPLTAETMKAYLG